MRNLNDPQQSELFDFFEQILSPAAYRKLKSGGQHLFRCVLRKLMRARKLAEHFHPDFGRPTQKLYSMAALLFVMEFRDWTHEQDTDAYMVNVDSQYALNLRPENQSLCRRTIERYSQLFREDELAQTIMLDVTAELVKLLDLDVSKRRLDATRIRSNMAKFSGSSWWRQRCVVFSRKLPATTRRATSGFPTRFARVTKSLQTLSLAGRS